MNKIEKVYNILKRRLPKKYIVPIKIFKTTKDMIKHVAKKTKWNYNRLVKGYTAYFQNNPTYIKTKYFIANRKNAFDITALSGNPILISRPNAINRPDYEIAHLILHEMKHNTQSKKSEKEADLFARRWVRKLIKEGLISYV